MRSLFICVTLLVVSCQKENDPLPAIIKISSGEWKGYNWMEEIVISDQAHWMEFVNQINPLLRISGITEIDEADIDFNTHQVVAVFDALKGAAGYSLEVTGVVEINGNTVVSVLHHGPVRASVKEVTQAFVIARIPRSEKPIIFKHEAVPPRIYPYTIGQGALKGNPYLSQEDMVITSQEEWTALLIRMNFESSVDWLTYYPAIDFTKYMIVATFDQRDCSYPCSSSVSRDITDIIEEEDSISVTVQSLWITLTEGYPQPFHIVKILKSDKPVVFVL